MVSKPNESFCLLGARGMLQRLGEMTGRFQGVRNARNLDAVHDARVASRRLRTGFSVFRNCLPGKRLGKWRKQVRKITRVLGQARDLDVQMDFLQTALTQISQPGDKPGVERLLLRLRQRREHVQSEVIKELDRLERKKLVGQMEQALGRILVRGGLRQTDERPVCNFQQAHDRIAACLEKMLAFEPYVYQPERQTEHHKMRIAAKHLRYTVEYFQPLFGTALDKAHDAARKIQTLLGDLHDCVVWVQYLSEFSRDEEIRTRDYFGDAAPFGALKSGLLYLQEDRARKKTELYQEFLEYWKKIKEEDRWGKLMKTLIDSISKGEVLS